MHEPWFLDELLTPPESGWLLGFVSAVALVLFVAWVARGKKNDTVNPVVQLIIMILYGYDEPPEQGDDEDEDHKRDDRDNTG